MKLFAIGCFHGHLPDPSEFDGADFVILTGDEPPATKEAHKNAEPWLMEKFNPWLKSLPVPKERIIATLGNHSITLEKRRELIKNIHWTCLIDQEYIIDGIKFWGTPWSVKFGNWAFMKEDHVLGTIYENIPRDTDVIISHGPPYGYGDLTEMGEHVGSVSLLKAIMDIEPKLVVTSHIHSANGFYQCKKTKIVNVSYLNEDYKPYYGVTTIEF